MSQELQPSGDSTVTLRKQGHKLAKILMRQGDYQTALEQIETTLAGYGSHVGLWADHYTCHYCLGNKEKAFASLENLKREFSIARPLLSRASCLSTQLVLAKGLEDSGEVALALKMLQLERAEWIQPEGIRLMILANLLRLKALLGDSRDLGRLYVLLSQRAFDPELNPYDQIEIQHALLLADCELIGPQNACARAGELFRQKNLDAHDRNLIYYDLLETLYLCKSKADIGVPAPEPQTDFERALKGFHWSPEQESKLSLSELLRLITCFLSTACSASEAGEWLNKFQLLLEPLSESSQDLWWARLHRKRQITLLVNSTTGGIHVGDRHFDLKVKSQSFQLLCELASTPKISLEEFAVKQGEREFNEVFQNRLRVAIHRLNQQLGLRQPLAQVSKTHIELSSMVSLILI